MRMERAPLNCNSLTLGGAPDFCPRHLVVMDESRSARQSAIRELDSGIPTRRREIFSAYSRIHGNTVQTLSSERGIILALFEMVSAASRAARGVPCCAGLQWLDPVLRAATGREP